MSEFNPKLKILEIAIDTRKFEIDMYWKRATYFWAFIAISFTGYFALLNSTNIFKNKEITIVISLIGFLFSFGWYLVNRGSKFWQENWERHVVSNEKKVLEEELFNKVINPTSAKWYRLHEGFPVSVSKINQILSMSIVLIWLYLILYSIGYYLDLSSKFAWFESFKTIGSLIYFSFVFIFCMFQFIVNAESKLSKDYKKMLRKNTANDAFVSLSNIYKS
jgi:ABC-type uncharacterized transport system permease subunit